MGIRFEDLNERQRAMIEPGQASSEPALPKRQETRPRLERDEQRVFASWLTLNGLPFCWHRTDKRSTANAGVFDFWVGARGQSAWIEFKRADGKLSPEQEQFKSRLIAQRIPWHIVGSANQAIEIAREWMVSG